MWIKQPVERQLRDCRQPFSFFFDLIHKYWRAGDKANDLAFHRICTFARKHGATDLAIQCALDRADVREEIEVLNDSYGSVGTAEAVTITFFVQPSAAQSIHAIANECIIGTLTIINYKAENSQEWECSYIYEAIIVPPFQVDNTGRRLKVTNNFMVYDAKFDRTIHDRDYTFNGVYYCQQNSLTHVCAHACLRMALNTINYTSPPITSNKINQTLTLLPPIQGLTIDEIVKFAKDVNGVAPMVADCSKVLREDYLAILSSYVESGCMVLLVFTINGGIEHVVTVFGYTRNSDEWHPQAVPAYSGPKTAQYYSGSAWVDHFLIHDDNFGPYYALSSRALEVDPEVAAHWIIAISDFAADFSPHYAESLASVVALSFDELAGYGNGKWFDYITGIQHTYVMRAILMKRSKYKDHLIDLRGHDGTALVPEEIALTDQLPEWFWMVEFSLPPLFTGNKSKLGEIFISTNSYEGTVKHILGFRLPSLFVFGDGEGGFFESQNSLLSHSQYYRAHEHDNEW
ncbi:hypothetical protein [Rhodovulum sp. PH10]|uniref:hypothetical protein n=1 Tax=Rhodovulum sp. PH10 TaxID=1187851 RepID=UPI0012FB50ED|nr:hypothetical protein [Rhodovulum sp. PH10]